MYKYWSLFFLIIANTPLLLQMVVHGSNTFILQIWAISVMALIQIILLVKKQNFSIALIHWFFVLLFLGIVPFIKYMFNIFPLVSINNSPEDLLCKTNYIIILWCIVFSLTYMYNNTNRYGIVLFRKREVTRNVIYSISGVLMLLAGYVFLQRPLALFVRGGGINAVFSSNILKLIFQYFSRPSAFFLLVVVLFEGLKRAKGNSFYNFKYYLVCLIFLLYNSPVATARFYAFAIWLSVVSIIFLSKSKNGFKLLGILSGGIFGAELVSGFRGGVESALNSEIGFGVDYWTSMTFDAYEMLASAVSYTISNDYLYGRNIAGALAFFVPRSYWSSKPIGSGAFLMEDFYKFNNPYGDFTNVSCPLIAEAFLSFGYLGVVLVAFIAAFTIKFLDDLYRKGLKVASVGISTYRAYYFVAGGIFFFMMRGDLLSSWAYFTGITCSFLVIITLFKGRVSLKK